jgi:hypothetical protein
VLQIPFLRSDGALSSFLSVQNEKEWDKARGHSDHARDLFSENTIGCVKWRQLVMDEGHAVAGSERAVMDVWRQIERIEQVSGPCGS